MPLSSRANHFSCEKPAVNRFAANHLSVNAPKANTDIRSPGKFRGAEKTGSGMEIALSDLVIVGMASEIPAWSSAMTDTESIGAPSGNALCPF